MACFSKNSIQQAARVAFILKSVLDVLIGK